MSKTIGNFQQDRAGLWHYHPGLGRPLDKALADAIATRPGPAWFWFNGSFAPIYPGDDVLILHERFVLWRHASEKDPEEIVRLLERMSKELVP